VSLTILILRYSRSSFGWDPPQKKAELFYPDSRFILVWERAGNTSDDRRLSAFAMFRFDMEDDERIVYWSVAIYILIYGYRTFTSRCSYELQVAASARRQGLGQHLMKLLVILGRASDMEKVMLTVQKCENKIEEAWSKLITRPSANTEARRFYQSVGCVERLPEIETRDQPIPALKSILHHPTSKTTERISSKKTTPSCPAQLYSEPAMVSRPSLIHMAVHARTHMTIFLALPFFSESLWLTNSTSVASGPPSFAFSACPSTLVLKCLPMLSTRVRSSSSSGPGARRVQIDIR
jgi:GNAT superfamily N-acetyltransferase